MRASRVFAIVNAGCGSNCYSNNNPSSPNTPSKINFPDERFQADIVACQSGTGSSYSGKAFFSYNSNSGFLSWSIYHSMGDDITAAHVHDQSGVAFNLEPRFSPIIGGETISGSQLNDLRNGNMYVNLHNAAHPGGAISGVINGNNNNCGNPVWMCVSRFVGVSHCVCVWSWAGVRQWYCRHWRGMRWWRVLPELPICGGRLLVQRWRQQHLQRHLQRDRHLLRWHVCDTDTATDTATHASANAPADPAAHAPANTPAIAGTDPTAYAATHATADPAAIRLR